MLGLTMRKYISPLQTNIFVRAHGTINVFAVDGSFLPSLPSQNLTFTIMANAHRVATEFGLKNEEEKLKH
jgi:choline dehydrogenase-like flavoprotein